VNHELQQLFYFCLEAKGFFFGNCHLVPRGWVNEGLKINGLEQYRDTDKDFKAVRPDLRKVIHNQPCR
jgi:hypothetical protein